MYTVCVLQAKFRLKQLMSNESAQSKEQLANLGIAFSEQSFLDQVGSGVSLLLRAGVRATARNSQGTSAIVLASRSGRADMVKLLLDHGARLEDLVEATNSKLKEKDIWERLASVAPVATIISGLIVAAVGGWFTRSYNEAQVKNLAEQQKQDEHLKEIEIVEKMIPHLAESEQSKKAALVAISVLTDKTLSTKLAEVYQGNGSVDFLQELIASSSSTEAEKKAAIKAIQQVLDAYRPGIVKVTPGTNQWETGFVAEVSNGKATIVTTASDNPGPFKIDAWDGRTYSAQVKGRANELTYLTVDTSDLKVLKPSVISPVEGMRIIGVGFVAGHPLDVQLGTITLVQDRTITASYEGQSESMLPGFWR
jgi:hypothetical protein